MTLFLTGSAGSGKTHTLRKALSEVDLKECWVKSIDCRLFSDDRPACKEFLRQMGKPTSSAVLDVLRISGSGILIFDHFDQIKIIKRQFFLYTLFDSIHSDSISLCLILVTSSHEPLTNLEKRVKSRCSPICIEFPSTSDFTCKTFRMLFESPSLTKQWNKSVQNALRRPEPFDRVFSLSPSLHTAISFAHEIIYNIKGQRMTSSDVEQASIRIIDSICPLRFLDGLSHLELILTFMSVFMLTQKRCNEFTSEAMYQELKRQLNSYQLVKMLTPERFSVAWDKLLSMRIIVCVGRDATKVTTTLFEDDILPFTERLPTQVQVWAKGWQ
ncbi:Origin recognition complex subunit 4 [Histomonas meleagridis]|uniref:Origin recognition complex subunit 4 n=1 Tax=Histomonas meleagridis TaxID=135588 RepID=UPI003559837E|nr:Origin recognition complex subunit 4 [Histomonas meleagridis]KAH0799135.1 Origin recognition complex subunit 4 [Histomonas meleagridis]